MVESIETKSNRSISVRKADAHDCQMLSLPEVIKTFLIEHKAPERERISFRDRSGCSTIQPSM
jgi:hypothetical protein